MKLKIDNLVIKSCKKYVYFGIVFTPGNNFRTAQKELYKKACKTLFTYLSVINVHTGAQISTVKKLFDTLVRPVLLYNSEIWGAFLRPKQLRSLRTFSNSLFDDNQNHESLQLKMAKIVLNIHKRANDLAVRGEIGMYPLSIEIYKNMIKYFCHLIELAEKGNQIISCRECLTLVNNGEKCWLTSVLYIFNLVGINPDMEQLHLLLNNNVLSSIADKLQNMFKEKFFSEIANSTKLILYSHVREEFREEKYIHEVKYYKYRSAITKFRISAHTFPVESEDGIKLHVRNTCVLCVFQMT